MGCNFYLSAYYNPLIIELLAKNIAQFNRIKIQYSLNDLLIDLQQKGLFALKTKVIATDYHLQGGELRSAKPEDIIESMYDMTKLTDTERNILTIISDLPAQPIVFDELEKILGETIGVDDILLNLAQKGWLEYNESEATFKIPLIIQMIVRYKNAY